MYEKIEAAVSRMSDKYNEAKSDGGVSWMEAMQLFCLAIMEVVRLLETLPGDGASKKAAALQAAGAFFDNVIAPIDLPGIPNIVEGLFDSGLRKILLTITDGLIEALVMLYNQAGWPENELQPRAKAA